MLIFYFRCASKHTLSISQNNESCFGQYYRSSDIFQMQLGSKWCTQKNITAILLIHFLLEKCQNKSLIETLFLPFTQSNLSTIFLLNNNNIRNSFSITFTMGWLFSGIILYLIHTFYHHLIHCCSPYSMLFIIHNTTSSKFTSLINRIIPIPINADSKWGLFPWIIILRCSFYLRHLNN